MTATLAAARQAAVRIPLVDWELAPGIPARVPGTVASALRAQGAWKFGDGVRFDTSEHVFRCRFDADAPAVGERVALHFGGIATIADVSLNGSAIVHSESMFARHEVDVTRMIARRNELAIVCRPLADALREKKMQRPAARWRTRVVADQQLRWFRTTFLGRAPGFAPEPEPVGPWRPVFLERASGPAVERCTRRVEIEGSHGIVRYRIALRDADARGMVFVGDRCAAIVRGEATVGIPDVRRWWPHTHGSPALYPVRIELDCGELDQPPVGFRAIDFRDGFEINGQKIFARGVVWTPPDPISLAAPEAMVRARLERLRDGGFNLIRLAGTMLYEDDAFHRLCDELGLMVWQDMMFANMDYPFGDAVFGGIVREEAERELARVSRHASTALICGNSEVEQQAAMLGLDPANARAGFFGEELPGIVDRVCPGVPYLPSAPCGGDLPFRARAGVANYFGVGAYLRPLEDARRAGVRFASECLAFSNVPEPEAMEKLALATRGGISPTHPAWKRAVPRDSGTGWDFEDVRDHYLKLLYGVDPFALRYSDLRRYWELARMASAETMAEVFGEWRRAESSSRGGIVLWAADLEPGAGWGILDSDGVPKAAYWLLKRALAPRAVWITDEGLNGADVHVANDAPDAMNALLRVALYRHSGERIGEARREIRVAANETTAFGVEEILGRFFDASYAYRFGRPGHEAIVASLHDAGIPFAQAFRFPTGRPIERVPIADLGISAEAAACDDTIELSLSSRRLAWGVRAVAPGWLPGDCYFAIEPGGTRRITLKPVALKHDAPPAAIDITALNAEGRLHIAPRRPA